MLFSQDPSQPEGPSDGRVEGRRAPRAQQERDPLHEGIDLFCRAAQNLDEHMLGPRELQGLRHRFEGVLSEILAKPGEEAEYDTGLLMPRSELKILCASCTGDADIKLLVAVRDSDSQEFICPSPKDPHTTLSFSPAEFMGLEVKIPQKIISSSDHDTFSCSVVPFPSSRLYAKEVYRFIRGDAQGLFGFYLNEFISHADGEEITVAKVATAADAEFPPTSFVVSDEKGRNILLRLENTPALRMLTYVPFEIEPDGGAHPQTDGLSAKSLIITSFLETPIDGQPAADAGVEEQVIARHQDVLGQIIERAHADLWQPGWQVEIAAAAPTPAGQRLLVGIRDSAFNYYLPSVGVERAARSTTFSGLLVYFARIREENGAQAGEVKNIYGFAGPCVSKEMLHDIFATFKEAPGKNVFSLALREAIAADLEGRGITASELAISKIEATEVVSQGLESEQETYMILCTHNLGMHALLLCRDRGLGRLGWDPTFNMFFPKSRAE